MRPAALSVGSVHVGRMGPPSAASQAVCLLRCTSWPPSAARKVPYARSAGLASDPAECSMPRRQVMMRRLRLYAVFGSCLLPSYFSYP